MASIQLIQFAAGLLFAIYIMISGLLGFADGIENSVIQGKLITGLVAAAITVFSARLFLVSELPAITAIAYPVVYVATCLALNEFFDAPFGYWPLISTIL
ncbi:MAG: hypothetical protein ACRBBW_06270 [Cellvibrionaceae bacterium]